MLLRLRSGQNSVPYGNVVPFLHKYAHAIPRKTNAEC
jgi:hypothetical protein